jgi:hypothetical protein
LYTEAGWAQGPVWTGAENLTATGTRSSDFSVYSESLYRLIDPGLLYSFVGCQTAALTRKQQAVSIMSLILSFWYVLLFSSRVFDRLIETGYIFTTGILKDLFLQSSDQLRGPPFFFPIAVRGLHFRAYTGKRAMPTTKIF